MIRPGIAIAAALLAVSAGCKHREHAGTPATAGTAQAAKSAEHDGKKAEHGGKSAEHGGKSAEHGGKSAEHGGKSAEHGGKSAEHGGHEAKTYTAEQIKAAMNAHIRAETAKNGNTLVLKDEKTAETLSLSFVKIHDPVRVIKGKGYFACTDFHPKGSDASQLYDLDFWLKPDANGNLAVYETKIHKHPERKNGKWSKTERYTFVDDEPVEVK